MFCYAQMGDFNSVLLCPDGDLNNTMIESDMAGLMMTYQCFEHIKE